MDTRIIERFYPYLVTFIILFINHFFFKNTVEVFQENPSNIISTLMTLSTVSLGFVCAMVGVLISIKDSSIMKLLKSKNALNDLFKYVKEACFFDFISLGFSMYFFMTLKESSNILQFHAYLLLSLMLILILSSYRMISILFALTKSSILARSDKEFEEKKICKIDPNKIRLPSPNFRKKQD